MTYDSDIPPHCYFHNAPICYDFVDFLSSTIMKRLEQGSLVYLGKAGVDPPPRVVNALSVEPTKPRKVVSMRLVYKFLVDKPFRMSLLPEIVRHIPPCSFFSSFGDTQGFKQVLLSKESQEFCGFYWGGHWFADATLPFGWKSSAYVYSF